MGYYSDVRCLIYGEPDVVQAFWARQKLSGNAALIGDWVSENIERYSLDWGTGVDVIDLNLESVKWYPDFPEVAGFMQMVDDIDCEAEGTEGLTFEYIEIGENNDDLTTRSGGADVQGWIWVNRNIGSDMPQRRKEEPNEQATESQG